MMYKAVIFDFFGTLFTSEDHLEAGAIELLDALNEKGLKLAAVTAGTYDVQTIERLGLRQRIPLIKMVSAYEGKTPEVFAAVIEELGVTPQEVIGVGDLLHREIKSLNQLGSTTISVHTDREASGEHEEPDYRAKNLHEVNGIIDSLMPNV